MNKSLLYPLGCTALSLGLACAPWSDACAGQTITISNTMISHNVFGNGEPPEGIMPGGDPGNLGSPDGNSVSIKGSEVLDFVVGGGAYSNSGPATATGNSVTMASGGKVYADVWGGLARDLGSGSATVTGNKVTVTSGGEIYGFVYGGGAYSDSGSATATGNTVTINGGVLSFNVYGGYADSYTGSATATGNTVTISNSPTFGGDTILYGGNTTVAGVPGAGGDAFTGNTLNVWNYSGSAVAGAQNFENYNFILPASLQGLHATGSVDFTGPDGVRSTVTGVNIMGGGSVPQPGQQISLIHADGGFASGATIANNNDTLAGKKGATLSYLFRLDQRENDLYAVVTGVQAAAEAKTLSEGFLSGMTLLNQSGDLIAGQGMSAAANAAYAPNTGYGLGVFGTVSGGWMRHDTGSSVEMSSVSLMAGVSKRIQTQPGNLVVGAFLEYGNGSYDTYSALHGEGDVHHLGGGIIGRMDLNGGSKGHCYVEASVRVGSIDNDYDHSGLYDAFGREANYDGSSTYYGIHLATGYIANLTDKTRLDLYGKYFWTRQDGDSVWLATGDPINFDAINSHRLRFGGRFSYAADQTITPYIGAAWEHEFDGEARATTYGYSINAPSLEGDTGIGELGVTFRPSANMPISLDLAVQGYVGTREGATGSVQLRYDF